MIIEQAVATPNYRERGAEYLRKFVEGREVERLVASSLAAAARRTRSSRRPRSRFETCSVRACNAMLAMLVLALAAAARKPPCLCNRRRSRAAAADGNPHPHGQDRGPPRGGPKEPCPRPPRAGTVTAFASGLEHPRWVHVLPNGDVLVAETSAPKRPDEGKGLKGRAMGVAMKKAGSAVPSANRITLRATRTATGVAEMRSPFLGELNSPFGMALIGNDLYVANTDAGGALSVFAGRDAHRRGGREGRRPASGYAQSSLDQEPDRQPRRDKALRHGRLEQQRREHGIEAEEGPRGDLGNRIGKTDPREFFANRPS
jgi:hypothetical protein